jgi:hypothetical protein
VNQAASFLDDVLAGVRFHLGQRGLRVDRVELHTKNDRAYGAETVFVGILKDTPPGEPRRYARRAVEVSAGINTGEFMRMVFDACRRIVEELTGAMVCEDYVGACVFTRYDRHAETCFGSRCAWPDGRALDPNGILRDWYASENSSKHPAQDARCDRSDR